jgi:hypothetical protein
MERTYPTTNRIDMNTDFTILLEAFILVFVSGLPAVRRLTKIVGNAKIQKL